MNSRDALHFVAKFNYSTVVMSNGFHVPVSAQLLKHLPFNPPGLSPEWLTFARLI